MPRLALPTDVFKRVDDVLDDVRGVLGRVDTTLSDVEGLLTELRDELELLHRLPALATKVDEMHAMLEELLRR
jgi:ABC-type transporter Mla subunit MlaD